MNPYTDAQTAMQEQFGSTALADRWPGTITADTLGAPHDDFVASRDFFFLATVDSGGMPTVSYKGGPVGLVTIPDAAGEQAFPSWKRLDLVNDVLSPEDRDRTEAVGGVIDLEEYATRLITGEA